MAKTENGYFLIADITGYTIYLNESELEHAHEVLQTLLELLIEHTRPPLVISRLAGDAVISYGLGDGFLQGQTFLEMIEDTYVAFRKAIDLMVLNNTCQCNACTNIGNLDLKFFVHYGAFTRQKLDRHDELLGPDVNLIHRLLKNSVTEQTGLKAYALFTDAAIRQMGIEDVRSVMAAHDERYEHLGDVRTWVMDMQAVWDAKQESLRIEIPERERMFAISETFPVPVERMWDVLTNPDYRALFVNSVRQEVQNRQHGRIGEGSQYQCYHGDGTFTTQTVVEWIPFRSIATEDLVPVPKVTSLTRFDIEAAGEGTRVHVAVSKGRGPLLNRMAFNLVAGFLVPANVKKGIAALQLRLEEEIENGEITAPHAHEIDLGEIKAAIKAELNRAA